MKAKQRTGLHGRQLPLLLPMLVLLGEAQSGTRLPPAGAACARLLHTWSAAYVCMQEWGNPLDTIKGAELCA